VVQGKDTEWFCEYSEKSVGVCESLYKEGKPISIQKFIGRRPIAAFGNSDGDLQMLQWTAGGPGPSFCLYVHHDDSDREWAYDRQSSVGRLDKGLGEARVRDWTVVSMRSDWKRIFVFENNQEQ
jgi:hypothetical protein